MRLVPRTPKTQLTPLNRAEETAWRAIARAVLVVPKTLDADLLAGCGLSLAEYIVLVNLSEAPQQSLRMFELAAESTLTYSGVTRLVTRMEQQGLVARQRDADDARGMTTTLTPDGLVRLQEAYPFALASIRANVIDHLGELDLATFAAAVSRFASEHTPTTPRRARRRPETRRAAAED